MDMDNTVFIYENFLDKTLCQPYINKISERWSKLRHIENGKVNWNIRTIDITNDPIVIKVKKFLEEQLSVRLICSQAQIQIWPENVISHPHKHVVGDRKNTDFNSLIYLNDNFGGGEFYTEKGVCYKPTVGALTFFNGAVNMHGIKKVIGADRFTLVFWWTNTVKVCDHS
jgi:hypothetical protein